ncbi:unnamed protein product [Sphenostylis stenocarpa]|uniref:Uncharacterized protein n=1 Tax=Sphenostylis stenocarpa TaxID=92480 RepID=A0AA86VFK5_9FABA|nr:unnamed protein product [Sphenostylis stenocarpa]
MDKPAYIAVIPSAGFSHFAPILHFSKRLVEFHPHFHVTCLVPSIGSLPTNSKAILHTLPPNINPILLPPFNLNHLPQGLSVVLQIQRAMRLMMPSIHQILKSITSNNPHVAMVVDSFACGALDFAHEFNMLSYVYFPSSATTLSTHFYLPKLDEETSCEYRDLPCPIEVPGCVPFHGRDLYIQAQDRKRELYKVSLERYRRFLSVDGIIMNSFLALETGPLRALKDEGRAYPPVYPIGPIVKTGTDSAQGLECLTWLDKQQVGSVLYVSFGSGGTLSQEQMNELACGLELSNHKFLWVVRAPNNAENSLYLSEQKCVDPVQFLLSGFLERTKEQGVVIPSWCRFTE